MSHKRDCPFCGFSYAGVKQGREYLYHDEITCEVIKMRARIEELEALIDARSEAADEGSDDAQQPG